MDFLTSTILSGMLYDCFKTEAILTIDFLKEKLQGWLFDDLALEQLVDKLSMLELNESAEHVIERKINESPDVLQYLQQIKPAQSTSSVVQNHYGSGDNVVNKTIYNK